MYLKGKSEHNISAAQMLIENKLYAPSVHCAYYSCFQLMKYVLNELGVEYTEQETLTKNKDSHKIIISQVEQYITNFLVRQNFNRYCEKLKIARKKSDYQNEPIISKEAKDIFGVANKLRELLTLQCPKL